MKPKKKILALLLAAVILTGGISALAAAGTSDNPLVTLSYLTDTFKKVFSHRRTANWPQRKVRMRRN